MFDIRLSTDTPDEMNEGAAVYGQIQLGDFKETYIASLSDWAPEQYRRQWLEAAKRLVGGEPKSAFVTSFVSPKHGRYFVWWPCYRVGDTVYIQNQLRFYEQIGSPFDDDRLYSYVADRQRVSEDNAAPISEWEVPLPLIRDFLSRAS